MFIEDPQSGNRAEVNTRKQLRVEAGVIADDALRTIEDESVFSLPIDALDPTGADDYFTYVKNESDAFDLLVTGITLSSTVTTIVEVQRVTGTAVGGTAVVPVNNNFGSSKTANITYQTGVDITGLTVGGILELPSLLANTPVQALNNGKVLVLAKGQALALLIQAATGIISGIITMYMRPIE